MKNTLKFLADENIPLKVVKKLKQEGFDIISISKLKPGINDYEVIELACKMNRIIITFDKDLGRMVILEKIKPPGLIILRIIPKSVEYIYNVLKKVLTLTADFYNKFIIVKRKAIKVLKFSNKTEG